MTKKPKPKKRGRKPGVKVGPYKKRKHKLTTVYGNTISLDQMDKMMGYEKAAPSLISELQSTISQLEGQLTAQIDRIKSILV